MEWHSFNWILIMEYWHLGETIKWLLSRRCHRLVKYFWNVNHFIPERLNLLFFLNLKTNKDAHIVTVMHRNSVYWIEVWSKCLQLRMTSMMLCDLSLSWFLIGLLYQNERKKNTSTNLSMKTSNDKIACKQKIPNGITSYGICCISQRNLLAVCVRERERELAQAHAHTILKDIEITIGNGKLSQKCTICIALQFKNKWQTIYKFMSNCASLANNFDYEWHIFLFSWIDAWFVGVPLYLLLRLLLLLLFRFSSSWSIQKDHKAALLFRDYKMNRN